MRKKLGKINNIRTSFSGTFVRYGKKSAYRGEDIPTILLQNICQGDVVVADHIWFTKTKGFTKIGHLWGGEKIIFQARVKKYEKGYKGWNEKRQYDSPISEDYKLSHPTKIEIASSHEQVEEEVVPEFFSVGVRLQEVNA